jgi:hypothetical protein
VRPPPSRLGQLQDGTFKLVRFGQGGCGVVAPPAPELAYSGPIDASGSRQRRRQRCPDLPSDGAQDHCALSDTRPLVTAPGRPGELDRRVVWLFCAAGKGWAEQGRKDSVDAAHVPGPLPTKAGDRAARARTTRYGALGVRAAHRCRVVAGLLRRVDELRDYDSPHMHEADIKAATMTPAILPSTLNAPSSLPHLASFPSFGPPAVVC